MITKKQIIDIAKDELTPIGWYEEHAKYIDGIDAFAERLVKLCNISENCMCGATIQDDMRGFLHRHPRMEMNLMLDSNHCIVDMEDWKKARMMLKKCLWINSKQFMDVKI